MIRRSGLAATAFAAMALALAACGAYSTGGAASVPVQAPTAAASTCAVAPDTTGAAAEIKGFAFPSGLTVKAGEAITWSNGDAAPHTVTFDDGSCSSGSIAAGSAVTVRYDVAGTYAFHCEIHSSMKGTLVVGR